MKIMQGFFIFILLAFLWTASCTPTVLPHPESVNLLFILDGKVEVRRAGWSGYFSISSGAILYWGDLVKPSVGARAVVLCADLSSWPVPAGVPSGINNGCIQNNTSILVRSEGNIGETRGYSDPLIPYVISPRATKLLTDRPLLRWNAVTGAHNYRVTIRGGNIEWQMETGSNQLVYPGNPVLRPGETYLLIVETDTGQSSQDEKAVGLGFTKLSTTATTELQESTDKIMATDLPPVAKEFAIAQLYASRGLIAESIQGFEESIVKDSSNPHLYLMLGDLYLGIGLLNMAELNFQHALDVVQSISDPESIAVAQEGLGKTYLKIGNKNEAIKWLHQAEITYDSLGDLSKSKELQSQQQKIVP